ncbi:MAG: hypothetical protein HYU66_03000 [Armatimonadetes bacterium]|nr:hypothetical protein [Armatimonadota bacterium]
MVRLRPALVFVALGLALASCDGGAPPAGAAAAALRPRFYSADSPFNVPVPAGARVDPLSAAALAGLAESARHSFVLGWRRWSVPVYFVDAATPRYRVRLTADWAPRAALRGVPIPGGAQPDPEDDGQLCLIDADDGCEWDLWQARRDGAGWSASWANVTTIRGDGLYARGLSARGSGFALAAGLVWPEELRAGRIDHALVMSYDFVRAGGPVPPATESDGESQRADALPEGARLQLDPELDLDTLGLAPWQAAIARALQVYGVYLADSGEGVELYAVNPLSLPPGAFDGLLPDDDYPDLSPIPINRLRVLELPPQVADPPLDILPSPCAEFE